MTATKPTLKAIAARAGVATSTASAILRGTGEFPPATVRRVMAAADALGHVRAFEQAPADTAPTSQVAGVVVFNTMAVTLRDPFAQQVIRGLHGGLAGAGMALMLLPPVGAPGFDRVIRTMPLDIVFFLSTYHRIDRAIGTLAHRGVPSAYLENGGPHSAPAMVRVDDRAPMRDLGQHVLELGHSRVAVVSLRLTTLARSGLIPPPPASTVENDVARVRLEGLELAGVEISHVFETRSAVLEEGIFAAHTLMRLVDPPTCIVCLSDSLAEGVMVGLTEMGLRVPEDVSVTGYDGVPLRSLAPRRLTTVIQDGVLKGMLFAQAGRELLAGGDPEPAFLTQYFVRGTTTGPPRSG